ncbi:MAG: tetratricopeptide repeat protein [Chloroflexi bacterium]|nr:tetratricopeptide repeat protein [Chloroflexota bacterium]
MTTRLSVYCDKLLEAGWLAALVVAPLFFNIYSSRVFEPDKAMLIRSLALVMIGAWIVKHLELAWRAGSESASRASLARALRALPRDNPFALPVFAIIVAYSIATIFSVVPSVSLWGSYQRLQGTYSTFSYIAISVIAASALRTRAQLDRAINTILVVSFPIAFYGLLQHFRLDPLPWGGDTVERIAANMGNSIFVAAYLIMALPLALARWLETLARATRHATARALPLGGGALALMALTLAWLIDFTTGTALALGGLVSVCAFALIAKKNFRDALLAGTYTILLAVLFVAIFFTQSRGPWLGLAGGLFAFVVVYALARGARQVMLLAIGVALVASAFLAVFNLPASPFDALKQVPYVGRLGRILETEGGTGRVRELIWQGALPLFLPHAPLWSPTTGDDPFNVIRPLVGYGPEAMYVAFNPFYPPELGRLEARNASPDRSHNETFDALVMTGLLGFGAYILLFVSVFYFGLKWLGFVRSPGERNAFVALWLASGLLASLVFGVWRGWHYIGVALPFGMIIGLFVYLSAHALRHYDADARAADPPRALWLSALLAALIGHFIEIHFGIAIVSTRTYFWFYVALLVILGMNKLVATPAPEKVNSQPSPRADSTVRRRARRHSAETARAKPVEASPVPVIAWTAITTLIGVTLAFEFVTNQIGTPNSLDLVFAALLTKGNEASYGVALLFGLTWLIAGIIGLGEEYSPRVSREILGYEIALFVVLSFTAWLWFVLLQTRGLTQSGDLTNALINLLGLYYLALFLFVAVVAFGLWSDVTPRPAAWWRAPLNWIVAPILLFALPALIYLTNYSSVAADIHYKAGLNYDAAGAWDKSIEAYQRAFALQPTQDFYALFLGRANLEASRGTSDPARRAAFVATSEKILQHAQRLNPLNTDHTANLARMNRIVAGFPGSASEKNARYAKSSEYYQAAVRLSPYTAYLYNEWSQTYTQSGDPEKARAALEKSLTIDDQYAQTYFLLGEYYRTKGDPARAADYYLKTIALDPGPLAEPDGTPSSGALSVLASSDQIARAAQAFRAAIQKNPHALFPHIALAELYRRGNQFELARQELERAVEIAPGDLMARLTLVNFLSETGQIDAAVTAMARLLATLSPQRTPDYQRFQEFYNQLQNLQKQIDAVKNAPNDVAARRALAQTWKARGQPQFALPEYQALARLAPNDYDAQKNAALLSLQTNHPEDAQRALVSAVALAPENEKGMWQNIQVALNAQKTNQLDAARQAAQAALALAPDADKAALQAWVSALGK